VHVTMLEFDQEAAPDAGPAALVARLPALRMCIRGALRRVAGKEPARSHAALLAFDDERASARLADPARARELLDGTGIAPSSLQVQSIDATFQIALEPRRPGQPVFALIATFDYADGPGDAVAAERHYLEVHVARSRELPGMRGYVTGKLLPHASMLAAAPTGAGALRQRMGIEMFDSREMLALAFRSPVGAEVMKDAQYVCADVEVYHLDGEVVI
jgi:uncharacterized protein (TIGR02118 family)